jgi:hypothetical protein
MRLQAYLAAVSEWCLMSAGAKRVADLPACGQIC